MRGPRGRSPRGGRAFVPLAGISTLGVGQRHPMAQPGTLPSGTEAAGGGCRKVTLTVTLTLYGRKTGPTPPSRPLGCSRQAAIRSQKSRGGWAPSQQVAAARKEPRAHRGTGPSGGGWAAPGMGGSNAGEGQGWGLRGGQARLTSWEISRCFLAKVRACAGLPMDT